MTQDSAGTVSSKDAGPWADGAKTGPWMVLVILLLALGLRVGYVLSLDEELRFPDEKQYMNIAENFVRGKGLLVSLDSRTDALLHYPLEIQRMPVYPLVLALFTKAGVGITGVRLMQALVGALTCVMIYLVSARLFGERTGRIAGLISTVYPFTIYFTGCILSETLFLLLFVTTWYYVVRTWREISRNEPTTRWVASCLVAGLLAALTVLTRASALPVFLLVPLVWLVIGPHRVRGVAASLVMVLVFAVGLSPWVARNYKRSGDQKTKGRLVITTCKVGESLYEAVGPFATGGPNKENTEWPTEANYLSHDEYARDRYLLERSLAYMKSDPLRTLRLGWVKFLRTWNVVPNYEAARTPFHVAVSLASYVPVLLTAILGLFVGPGRTRERVWLLLPVAVIALLHMVFVGSVRYRLAAMPFVMVLSAAGVSWAASKVFKRSKETVENNG